MNPGVHRVEHGGRCSTSWVRRVELRGAARARGGPRGRAPARLGCGWAIWSSRRRYAWSRGPLPVNGTTRLKLQCDSFHMNFSVIRTLSVENLGHRGRTKAPRVHGELHSVTTLSP